MAQGSKEKYSAKQKKQAEHIEAGYKDKGVSDKKAEAIAWATVNKQTGGGELSGSGKYMSENEKTEARRDSAQHAVDTKRQQASDFPLERESKISLLEKARIKKVAGRSTMNKAELILALRRT